jgi:hypothetical protein
MMDKDVSRNTGVPAGTICSMRRRGAIPPGEISDVRALGLAVSRGLRSRGVSVAQAARVLMLFWDMPLERLEACLARGARYVLLIGSEAVPRLVQREAVTRNPAIPAGVAFMAGLVPALIDVGTVWARIQVEKAKAAQEEHDGQLRVRGSR